MEFQRRRRKAEETKLQRHRSVRVAFLNEQISAARSEAASILSVPVDD